MHLRPSKSEIDKKPPGNYISFEVGKGNLRVVESSDDVTDAGGNIFAALGLSNLGLLNIGAKQVFRRFFLFFSLGRLLGITLSIFFSRRRGLRFRLGILFAFFNRR